ELARAVLALPHHPSLVGVFVNTPAKEVNRIAGYCSLDLVQLSGTETRQYCQQIERPLIKVVHVSAGKTYHDIVNEIEAGSRLLAGQDIIYLLDTKISGIYGGTGQTFDWQLAQQVSERFPVMVAGGLTPANVGKLVSKIHPWGVDVSSGVETNGQKNIAKIKAFIHAIRNTETERNI
ncbi:MAG: phosphoribosylanthranilate isomerase, partial [Chloroflexota bacterium]